MNLGIESETIKNVYPHMFQVEYREGGTARLYMHQYTDIITKDIEILELSDIKTQLVEI